MPRKVNRLSQMLDMPRELDKKQTKLTIISFDEVLIENYKGIMEYEEFFVKINTEIGTININGFNLNLEQMTNEDILVKGVINSIDLERIN
ncbi:MAG: YabP/YqfC family sporulation protein [Clostridia bacterium]